MKIKNEKKLRIKKLTVKSWIVRIKGKAEGGNRTNVEGEMFIHEQINRSRDCN